MFGLGKKLINLEKNQFYVHSKVVIPYGIIDQSKHCLAYRTAFLKLLVPGIGMLF